VSREALQYEALRRPFGLDPERPERVGIEVEFAAVDPSTGITVGYEGPRGIRALLEAIAGTGGCIPVYEGEHIIGLRGEQGGLITLEPGGALEYSSRPQDDLCALIGDMRETVPEVARIADGLGISLVATGSIPFNKLESARWMPKSRYQVMRDHFKSLGEPGSLAWRMMSQTLSVQVSYDYRSEEDLGAKMRGLVAVAPIATGLFANSPLEEGELAGALSRRGEIWLKTDPARCGFVSPALDRQMSLDDYIEWALDVPMMFRTVDGFYKPMLGRSFRSVFGGFDDGSAASLADWEDHLSGIFTDVRIKTIMEMRSIDGQSWESIPSVAAFFSGLCYHRPSLDAAAELLAGPSEEQRLADLAEICRLGLGASYDGKPVLGLAKELVRLAKEGLEARIFAGLERAPALEFLAPLEAIVDSGRTAAEDVIDEWNGPLGRSPAAFVERYRVPC